VPAWGSLNIRAVRTIEVEHRLHQLRRADGEHLAVHQSKRSAGDDLLFNHAVRWQNTVEQDARRNRHPGPQMSDTESSADSSVTAFRLGD